MTETVARAAGRKILVADDDQDSAESLAMLFQLMGHEVRAAQNGLAAVDLAETFRPDLIVLDIGMPGLDGYEVCRRIRRHEWGQAIVIAALTGWARDEDKGRSQQAGFNHHLVKPVDPKALEDLIALVTPAESPKRPS
ncbi:MAG TPA: response regulator [Vicinamibacterales bacterium]|nr:response regulator [Vicinamibacterales bacterium]